MPHIVVADPIHPDAIERLSNVPGVKLDHPGTPTNQSLAERLRHADGLIVRGTVATRRRSTRPCAPAVWRRRASTCCGSSRWSSRRRCWRSTR
jgi:hypothetical protein